MRTILRCVGMAAIAVAAWAGAGSSLNAALIDFESVPVGDLPSYTEQGVTFSTVDPTGIVRAQTFIGILGPFGTQGLVGESSISPLGLPIQAEFATLAESVSIEIGDVDVDADNLFLRAFDSGGTLLGSDTASIASSFIGLVTLSVTVPNIARVEFGAVSGFLGSSVVADNFNFTLQGTQPPPVAVSAPGSLLLFATGLAGLVFVGWRTRARSGDASAT